MANSRELIIGIRTKDASKASKDIKDIEKSIKGAEKSTRGFGKAADGAKKSLFSLAGVGKGLKDLGGKFDALGGKVKKFGNGLSKTMLPVAAALTGGTKMFMDLDTSIRKVSTLTNKEVLPVSQIRDETRRISDMSGIAQKEVAESMYDALSSGVDPSKVVGFTESNIKLVKAGFTDMPTAIDATTTVLNAYGDEAYEVSKIHDIMVKTQDKGKITVDQLGQSIGRVIPIAASANVNMDQLGATYSILTAQGIKANEATTYTRSMLAELAKTGSTADKVLRQKTNKSFRELMKDGRNLGDVLNILNEAAIASGLSLGDMFGNVNAINAANALFKEGPEAFNQMLAEMNNATGAVDANFNEMMGPAEKLNRTINKLKNNLIDLGAEASPALDPMIDKIGELSDWFKELDDGTKGTIVQWALILIAAGPLIAIFGTIIGVIGKVFLVASGVAKIFGVLSSVAGGLAWIFANPLGLALLAIIGVAIWVGTHFEKIKKRAEELGGGIKGYLVAALEVAKESFINLKNGATSALDAIAKKWESVKNFLKNPIQGIINIGSNIIGGLTGRGAGGGGGNRGTPRSVGRGGARIASHATGLNYVPYDNYLANLHKGEIILTAKASEEYRALGGDKDRVPKMVTNNNTTNNSRINNSYQDNQNNQVNNTNNAAPIINNYYTIQGNNPRDIAGEVEKTFENMFRNLRLQRV